VPARPTGARRPLADLVRELGPEAVYFPQDSHWTLRGGLLLTQVLGQLVDQGATRSWRTAPGAGYTGAADLPPLSGSRGLTRSVAQPVPEVRTAPETASSSRKVVLSSSSSAMRAASSRSPER
jgi:hypothetical protein